MKRVVWLTDLHLNFLRAKEILAFLEEVASHKPDAVLVGGDTGEAKSVPGYLWAIAEAVEKPVYFVLGNHDYYKGSMSTVWAAAEELCGNLVNLTWLDRADPVELTPNVGLIGHSGWADGRLGDYARSTPLNEYFLVEELSGLTSGERLARMQALAGAAVEHVERKLPAALNRYKHVIFLTHVPPFREACWHQGKISGDEWLPQFACRAIGEVLVEAMRNRPDRELTVLCGHTHGEGRAQILENLTVLTGGTEYGQPKIQSVFDFE